MNFKVLPIFFWVIGFEPFNSDFIFEDSFESKILQLEEMKMLVKLKILRNRRVHKIYMQLELYPLGAHMLYICEFICW